MWKSRLNIEIINQDELVWVIVDRVVTATSKNDQTPGTAAGRQTWLGGGGPRQQRNEWTGRLAGCGKAMTIPVHEGGHAWVGTVVLAQGTLSTGCG
jgi:hypothetical protein